MQVAAVDVQGALLQRNGIGDIRVAVSYRRHVVVEVDIAPPGFVEDMGALPPNQLDRLAVEQFRTGAERLLATLQEPRRIHVTPCLQPCQLFATQSTDWSSTFAPAARSADVALSASL